MKVQISIDDELLERVDKYAKDNYMSRSGLFTFSVSQFLNQAEVITSINRMSLAMQKIADNNNIDDDTMQELQDFERITKMLLQQK